MKAYTLRMEDQLLTAVKQLGLKQKKSIREIIIEALTRELFKESAGSESLKEKKMFERAAILAGRLSDEQIVASIRQDRDSR